MDRAFSFVFGLIGAALILAILFGPPICVLYLLFNVVRECDGRIHLGTLVLLSILFGMFLGLNLSQRRSTYRSFSSKHYGWPFPTLETIDHEAIAFGIEPSGPDETFTKLENGDYAVHDDLGAEYIALIWNVLLASTALLYTCRYSERRIRRRKTLLPNPMKRAPVKGALS